MKPLPLTPFEPAVWSTAKVPLDYHIEYDAHYYSVLYTYKGKPAILKATMTEIRICDEYNRLICRHPRSYRDFPLYITDDNHMPPEHLYYKEVNAHDGAYYRRWASVYGESMVTLIDRILRSSKHEEQAYKIHEGSSNRAVNAYANATTFKNGTFQNKYDTKTHLNNDGSVGDGT